MNDGYYLMAPVYRPDKTTEGNSGYILWANYHLNVFVTMNVKWPALVRSESAMYKMRPYKSKSAYCEKSNCKITFNLWVLI